MLGLVLIVLSAADGSERGLPGELPEVAVAARRHVRLRAGVGLAALFGTTDERPAGAVGISLDVGALVDDRFSFILHGEVGILELNSIVGTIGSLLEYALGDHFTLGAGVAFTGWQDYRTGYYSHHGLSFPLRVHFAPHARGAEETARRGLLIGLQLAPGFSLERRCLEDL